jgi:competence protein ComEA
MNSSAKAGAAKAGGLANILPYFLGALTMLALIGGVQWLIRKPDPPPVTLHAPPTAEPTATLEPTATPAPTATPLPITVFVSGAVQQPGLYLMAAEARLGDALSAAGGVTADAAASLINQAERLNDGAHIYVPTLAEAASAPPVTAGQSGGAPLADAAVRSSAGINVAGGLINLNLASLAELDALPGIGPSKAQAIIDHRPYATVDDLDRVPGIGASTLEQLRPLVTAD